jgi:hypothetical protein
MISKVNKTVYPVSDGTCLSADRYRNRWQADAECEVIESRLQAMTR